MLGFEFLLVILLVFQLKQRTFWIVVASVVVSFEIAVSFVVAVIAFAFA